MAGLVNHLEINAQCGYCFIPLLMDKDFLIETGLWVGCARWSQRISREGLLHFLLFLPHVGII